MITIDDLKSFTDGREEEVVRYRSIDGEKELALMKALPPHSFGDGHEVYNAHGDVIAMCPTAEWASLISRSLNERFHEWLHKRK